MSTSRVTTAFAALMALMFVVVAPAAGAEDYTSTGGASFSDPTPGPGETVTISGVTTPDTVVTVTVESSTSSSQSGGAAVLGKTTLGSTTSDSGGNYSLSVTLPASATGNIVLAVSAGGQIIASTSYAITGGGGGAAAQTPGTGGTDLPVTGSSSSMILGLSAALLAVGGLLLTVARRGTRQS